MGFPYFGKFVLQPLSSNVTIEFNGTTYYSVIKDPSFIQSPPEIYNQSFAKYVSIYYFEFESAVNFTVNDSFSLPPIHFIYLKNYTVNYSLEVRPIVEYGPYYTVGKPQWISHTFVFT